MAKDNYKSEDFQKNAEKDNKRRSLNPRGFDTANENKYNIKQLNFPATVSSNEFPHYVMFYVNIRGKSKYNTENRFKDQVIEKAPGGPGLNTGDLQRATAITAAAGGALLGMGATKKLGGLLKGTKGVVTGARQVGGAVAGAAIGGGLAALTSNFGPDFLKADQSYRISDVITLATQEPPSVSYNAEWQGRDVGTLVGALAKISDISGGMKTAAAVGDSALMGMGMLAAGMLAASKAGSDKGAMGLAGGALAGATLTGTTMQAMTKTKTNPFREMLFESISERAFRFSYKFLPKSRAEVDNIKRIIDLFKFHMHPELTTSNLFFIYPAEFQIAYYFKGEENTFYQKIAPCALTSLNVTYGGAGGMSTFHDGTPTEINMSLDFKELEILTKERLEQGY